MHALVTGTSSGIGLALARAFASAGYRLTLISRTLGEAAALIARDDPQVKFLSYDLTEVDGLADLVRGIERDRGPIDVLVNNAGMTMVSETATVDPREAMRLMQVNLLTPLALTRAVLPSMCARREGTIVDIASVNAFVPTPGSYHYNAAKAGLAAASESLRVELAGTGVRVMTVYPGPVETPLLARASRAIGVSIPSIAVGKPDVLAQKILRGIHDRRARVIYPGLFAITRGFPTSLIERWLPKPPANRAPAEVSRGPINDSSRL